MPRVPARPAPTVTLVRGTKNGAKVAPPPRTLLVGQEQQQPQAKHLDEKEVCPLCVEDLDETDMSFQPCPCGYRVCLFCFEKLKLHCSSACPNCRRGYGSDEAMEYAKQLEAERLQEAQRPKPAVAPAPAASTSAAAAAASRALPKPAPAPAAARRDAAAPLPAAKRGIGALDDGHGGGHGHGHGHGHGAGHGHGPAGMAGLPSGVTWATAAPPVVDNLSRNQSVEIERPALNMDESSWPTLGGAPTAQQPLQQQQQQQQPMRQNSGAGLHTQAHPHPHQQQQHHHQQHHQQQQQQHHHQQQVLGVHASANGGGGAHPLHLNHRHSPSGDGLHSYDVSGAGTRRSSSVASSMDRVASSSSLELMSQDPPVTPEQLLRLQHQHQQYQAQHAQTAAAALAAAPAFPPMPPPGFEASSSYFGAQVHTTVNGLRRAVNVPLALGGSVVEPYPEAPALLATMQQGVAQGTLSSKDAAAQLFALMRQKDHEGQASRARPGMAASKPPPGFGAPAAPAPPQHQHQQAAPMAAPAAAAPPAAAAVAAPAPAPLPAARAPPPPPGFSQLQGSVVPAPAAVLSPIQPPAHHAADSGFAAGAGQIGLNANGTPRTYSMWSGLPGMDLAAPTGLSSLWQNLNASALSIGGQLGGGATQPYNPLGQGMDQGGGMYGGGAHVRQPVAPGAPGAKAPPPGFGPAAYAGVAPGLQAQQQAMQQQQLGTGDAVLGNTFRSPHPYQPVGGGRYNPLSQPPVLGAAAYRPQLGAGL